MNALIYILCPTGFFMNMMKKLEESKFDIVPFELVKRKESLIFGGFIEELLLQ